MIQKHWLVIGVFAMALMGLKAGELAPDFAVPNQDGKTVHLSDFKGKPVLVYFYPKDDTPGCTKEACMLRDNYSQFQKRGAIILGVSTQDEKSHQAFRTKHNLPFDLLVDKDGVISKAFGIAKIPIIGILKRKSVLVGADGKVVKTYEDVDPSKHSAEVLADLEKLRPHASQP